jgi:transaldolase
MKIFIDTANIEEIRKAVQMGVIDGVTTNPSLLAKEKGGFERIVKEILSLADGPVSLEVISKDADGMVEEAVKLSKLSKNVVVKIPMTAEGLKAVQKLNSKGVKTNVTLVFSANQALLAAKSGATYVSIFIGRLDDIGHDGMQVVRDSVAIFKMHNFASEIIVASIRHPLHVIEAAKSGAQVATIPFAVIEKMMQHPLTDIGLERFLSDWRKVK